MKLRHQIATLSYCPDLTDPDATSYPVAVFLIGEMSSPGVPNVRLCALISSIGVDVPDPLVRHLLHNAHPSLTSHIDDLLAQAPPQESIEQLMQRFHDSFRNSLHVSQITPLVEVSIPDRQHAAAIQRSAVFQQFEGHRSILDSADSYPSVAYIDWALGRLRQTPNAICDV